VPMVVAAGVAIDMSRVSATHTQIQAALDSAALQQLWPRMQLRRSVLNWARMLLLPI
jgi:hypothetical protein